MGNTLRNNVGIFGRGRWQPALLILLWLVSPACGQRQAEEPWWERSFVAGSEHYWIRTDLPRSDAQAVARHLDAMYEEYSRRLASLPQRAPMKLNVYLFKSRRDYELTLRARFGVDTARTGGVFFMTNTDSGLALWTEHLSERRIKHVLQHEGFHQFAFSRFGNDLPLWANEGLAEFFGQAVLVGGTLVTGQADQRTLLRLKDSIKEKTYTPFDEMISFSTEQWRAEMASGEEGLLYDQSWSMVHFLVYAQNGRWVGAFERYLRMINNGLTSSEAYRRAFETSETDAFEQRWRQFLREAVPSAFITALERIEFLAEGALELARRGIFPESLDDIRRELIAIDFTYRFAKHGRIVTLEATDDDVYRIPHVGRSKHQPVFLVSRLNLRQLTRRQRIIEEENPTPSIITTEDLKPRGLAIDWRRGNENSTFSYRIEVP